MVMTVHQSMWMTAVPRAAIRTDPTGVAPGMMTGIGLFGAGVIFRKGLTVRGLTTGASIRIIAAFGILIGTGFYFPAAVGVFGMIAVLGVSRHIERILPSQHYAYLTLKLEGATALTEEEMRDLLHGHGVTIANVSSPLPEGGQLFEYHMAILGWRRK